MKNGRVVVGGLIGIGGPSQSESLGSARVNRASNTMYSVHTHKTHRTIVNGGGATLSLTNSPSRQRLGLDKTGAPPASMDLPSSSASSATQCQLAMRPTHPCRGRPGALFTMLSTGHSPLVWFCEATQCPTKPLVASTHLAPLVSAGVIVSKLRGAGRHVRTNQFMYARSAAGTKETRTRARPAPSVVVAETKRERAIYVSAAMRQYEIGNPLAGRSCQICTEQGHEYHQRPITCVPVSLRLTVQVAFLPL
jgi:hypothetical protein